MLRIATPLTLAGILACTLAVSPALAADKAASAPAPAAKAQPAPDAVDARIAELHEKLHITAEQQASFDALAEVMRNNRKIYDDLGRERHRTENTMNAVDDLKSYAVLAQAHADGVKQLAVAFESFYGTLSDEQKKAADRMFRDYRHQMMARPRSAHAPDDGTTKRGKP